MNRIKYILSTLSMLLCCGAVYSQSIQERAILMRGEVHKEKVLLRWASTDAQTWRLLNKYGVQFERLTVVRDGILLNEPEKLIISYNLKPKESPQFMLAAEEYSYAAIIAQAVFGEDFIVSGSGGQDISSIIALSDELQQRYALSLYAADLCFPAALVAGWGWEDNDVRENERYLYNVVSLVPEDELSITPGALFVDASRLDRFPKPLDFNGQFMDGGVLLSWNYRTQEVLYNAYIPERSTDGINFSPISDIPITRMDSGTGDQITYTDSIANGTKYYYRLAGVTPFGSMSIYSDTISGMGLPELRNPPFITKAIPNKEGGVDIEWIFEDDEELIENFALERSENDKTYTDYITCIDRKLRSVSLSDVPSTNYFVVAANTITGKRVRSFSAFVQPVDSLPPAVPDGLMAITDTISAVILTWKPNKERDILGYRIFRSQTDEEEMIPLNDIAITDTVFVDFVNLKLLNHKVYYAVAALDERYNQSDKSPVVEVIKHETIPPTSPLIREIKVENGKNIILWVSGSEESLAGYELLRKADGEDEFTLLASLSETGNCIYEDEDVENNKAYIYHIKSRSRTGLLSEPSPDYKVRAINRSDAKHPIIFAATPRKEGVILNWEIPTTEVANIQLFKKTGDGTLSLFREGVAVMGEIKDENVVPGTKYEYMLVVKINGSSPQTVIKSVTL